MTPTIRVDCKIARNPEKPACERSTLGLVSRSVVPYAPECFLQEVLRYGAVSRDLEADTQNGRGMLVVKGFKRGFIASSNTGDQKLVAQLFGEHTVLRKDLKKIAAVI